MEMGSTAACSGRRFRISDSENLLPCAGLSALE